MSPLEFEIWYTIVKMLPNKLIYFCAMWVLAHATGDEYPHSKPSSLRAITAIKRFNDDFGVDK